MRARLRDALRPGGQTTNACSTDNRQVYCCIGALAIAQSLHLVDAASLGWWLCERQCGSGGLNGRPEKLPDVCYSWWVISSLHALGKPHLIDAGALARFIRACQAWRHALLQHSPSQDTDGGFADRPGDVADPVHTVFALAALALMRDPPTLAHVHPVYCMPVHTLPAHIPAAPHWA